MELMEAIRGRRSIRKFHKEPVNELDLREIIEAGTLAPNAENQQMWKFVAVTNPELLKKISDIVDLRVESVVNSCQNFGYDDLEHHKYFLTFFKDAPSIIIAFARPSKNAIDLALENLHMKLDTPISIDTIQQSLGAAIQNISLAAHAKGYGTTWMYGPILAYKEIRDLVGVTDPWVLTALLPIGKPVNQPKARPRKPLDEVFTLIK